MNSFHIGYTDITGIDYSDKAINLAKSIRDQKELKTDYQVKKFI